MLFVGFLPRREKKNVTKPEGKSKTNNKESIFNPASFLQLAVAGPNHCSDILCEM